MTKLYCFLFIYELYQLRMKYIREHWMDWWIADYKQSEFKVGKS
jgi:hypothetical protein